MIVRATSAANRTQHITPERDYVVIGLDQESYRVVNDNDEPILYPKEMLEVIDDRVPADWVWVRYSDDEYYADPPELASRGFFEDWHDRKPEARSVFQGFLERSKIR